MAKKTKAQSGAEQTVRVKRTQRPRREAVIQDVIRPRASLNPGTEAHKTDPMWMIFQRIIDTETCGISGWGVRQTVADPHDYDAVKAEYKAAVSEVGYSGTMAVSLVRIDSLSDFRGLPDSKIQGSVDGRVVTCRVAKQLREQFRLTKGEGYGAWNLYDAALRAALCYLDGHASTVKDGLDIPIHHEVRYTKGD